MLKRIIRLAIVVILTIPLPSCKKHGNPGPPESVIETGPHILRPVVKDINSSIGGYYSAVPPHYNSSSKKYPLLIFMHGGGQFGNGNNELERVLAEAVPEMLDEETFPPNFNVNGENFTFVILMPQFIKDPSNADIKSFIDYSMQHYRVDPARIYMAGFSNGGRIICDISAEYPLLFAAIVPIAGVSNSGNIKNKAKLIVDGKLPVWAFHNDNDDFVSPEGSKNFVAHINSYNPQIPAKFTLFPAFGLYGHDAWTKATDPYFKENNMNIYEWMLQYTR